MTYPANPIFENLSLVNADALTYQNTSAQSIASGSAVTVTGWTSLFDRVGTNFNATTGIFTAPAAGYYQVSAGITFVASASTVGNAFTLSVVANSVTVATAELLSQVVTSEAHAVHLSCLIYLAAAQVAEIQVSQNTGSAVALSTTAAQNWLSIAQVP